MQGTGTATYTRGLIEALCDATKHELFLYFRPGDEGKNPLTHIGNSNVLHRYVDGRGQAGRNLISLARAAKRDRLDVFHAPGYFLPLWRGPKVVTFHDVNMFLERDKWWRPGMRVGWLSLCAQTILSSRLADRVLADSHHAAGAISHVLRVSPSRISVVYPGVDKRFFASDAVGQPHKQNELGRFILSVGVLSPQKNLEGTLRAFAMLSDSELKLVLVGREDGTYFRQILQPLMRSLGIEKRVHAVGLVSDETLAELYAHAIALVYPSFAEGFGLPPLEAMASGLPVVAANRSSLPEILDGAAILVDPFSAEEIADAIARLCTDPELHKLYVALGRAQASKFGWRETASRAIEVYESVA